MTEGLGPTQTKPAFFDSHILQPLEAAVNHAETNSRSMG
jgi:hypothetical protein